MSKQNLTDKSVQGLDRQFEGAADWARQAAGSRAPWAESDRVNANRAAREAYLAKQAKAFLDARDAEVQAVDEAKEAAAYPSFYTRESAKQLTALAGEASIKANDAAEALTRAGGNPNKVLAQRATVPKPS